MTTETDRMAGSSDPTASDTRPTSGTDDNGAAPILADHPEAVLKRWHTTPYQLVQAYVTEANPAVRQRLSSDVKIIAGPGERIASIHAGDLLLRVQVGEGHIVVALVVDDDTPDVATAQQRGWHVETGLPGRYSWVVEDGNDPHPRPERWSRRVTDPDGFVLAGQAVLRPVVGGQPSGSPATSTHSADTMESGKQPAMTAPELADPP